jgi:membrane-associated protease RseP (regulator of RpoE activity)
VSAAIFYLLENKDFPSVVAPFVLTILLFIDSSVATVDYDYSKAYGGGGDTSVSSAGGTFGSQTQGQSMLDPANAAATGAALGGASFSDADSFEAAYRDPNANVKEELINVFAPPGKLGVVIDTPDDGAPVVHAVKDSSVIADKMQVGDKLVAVDDEDVRSMTAIKVSKLISRKSANPSRKLTIIRSTVIE